MSVEQILFLTFLVVLPLLQLLARVLRQQKEAPPRPVGPPPPIMGPPPRPVSRPGQDAEIALISAPEERSRPVAARVKQSRPVAIVRRRKAFDPRQAIVMMAVIGPCRAASPFREPGAGAER